MSSIIGGLFCCFRFSTSTFRLTSLITGVTQFSTEADLQQVCPFIEDFNATHKHRGLLVCAQLCFSVLSFVFFFFGQIRNLLPLPQKKNSLHVDVFCLEIERRHLRKMKIKGKKKRKTKSSVPCHDYPFLPDKIYRLKTGLKGFDQSFS